MTWWARRGSATCDTRPPLVSQAALAHLAAIAAGILVGGALVATRMLVDVLGPGSIAFLRYCLGFLLLLPPAWGARVRLRGADLLPIALLGILQFGILLVLLNWALQFIPSARAGLLFSTVPLLTLVIGAPFGLECLYRTRLLGVLLSIAGVGLALGEKVLAPGSGPEAWVGELAALGSAVCAAVASLLYRPYLRRYPTVQVSAFAMLAAVMFLIPFAAVERLPSALPMLAAHHWLAVLFLGFASGAGYFLWLYALGRTSATGVSVYLALSPVTATVFGALFLAEPVSVATLLGIALVALGLWLAQLPPPAKG